MTLRPCAAFRRCFGVVIQVPTCHAGSTDVDFGSPLCLQSASGDSLHRNLAITRPCKAGSSLAVVPWPYALISAGSIEQLEHYERCGKGKSTLSHVFLYHYFCVPLQQVSRLLSGTQNICPTEVVGCFQGFCWEASSL